MPDGEPGGPERPDDREAAAERRNERSRPHGEGLDPDSARMSEEEWQEHQDAAEQQPPAGRQPPEAADAARESLSKAELLARRRQALINEAAWSARRDAAWAARGNDEVPRGPLPPRPEHPADVGHYARYTDQLINADTHETQQGPPPSSTPREGEPVFRPQVEPQPPRSIWQRVTGWLGEQGRRTAESQEELAAENRQRSRQRERDKAYEAARERTYYANRQPVEHPPMPEARFVDTPTHAEEGEPFLGGVDVGPMPAPPELRPDLNIRVHQPRPEFQPDPNSTLFNPDGTLRSVQSTPDDAPHETEEHEDHEDHGAHGRPTTRAERAERAVTDWMDHNVRPTLDRRDREAAIEPDETRQNAELHRIHTALDQLRHDHHDTLSVSIRRELPPADREPIREAMYRDLGIADETEPVFTRSKQSRRGNVGQFDRRRLRTMAGTPYTEAVYRTNDSHVVVVERREEFGNQTEITGVDFVYVAGGAWDGDRPSEEFQSYLERPNMAQQPPEARWAPVATHDDRAVENAARRERLGGVSENPELDHELDEIERTGTRDGLSLGGSARLYRDQLILNRENRRNIAAESVDDQRVATLLLGGEDVDQKDRVAAWAALGEEGPRLQETLKQAMARYGDDVVMRRAEEIGRWVTWQAEESGVMMGTGAAGMMPLVELARLEEFHMRDHRRLSASPFYDGDDPSEEQRLVGTLNAAGNRILAGQFVSAMAENADAHRSPDAPDRLAGMEPYARRDLEELVGVAARDAAGNLTPGALELIASRLRAYQGTYGPQHLREDQLAELRDRLGGELAAVDAAAPSDAQQARVAEILDQGRAAGFVVPVMDNEGRATGVYQSIDPQSEAFLQQVEQWRLALNLVRVREETAAARPALERPGMVAAAPEPEAEEPAPSKRTAKPPRKPAKPKTPKPVATPGPAVGGVSMEPGTQGSNEAEIVYVPGPDGVYEPEGRKLLGPAVGEVPMEVTHNPDGTYRSVAKPRPPKPEAVRPEPAEDETTAPQDNETETSQLEPGALYDQYIDDVLDKTSPGRRRNNEVVRMIRGALDDGLAARDLNAPYNLRATGAESEQFLRRLAEKAADLNLEGLMNRWSGRRGPREDQGERQQPAERPATQTGSAAPEAASAGETPARTEAPAPAEAPAAEGGEAVVDLDDIYAERLGEVLDTSDFTRRRVALGQMLSDAVADGFVEVDPNSPWGVRATSPESEGLLETLDEESDWLNNPNGERAPEA